MKYLKLKHWSEGELILINVEHAQAIFKTDEGTKIQFQGDESYTVKESVSEVSKLLNVDTK